MPTRQLLPYLCSWTMRLCLRRGIRFCKILYNSSSCDHDGRGADLVIYPLRIPPPVPVSTKTLAATLEEPSNRTETVVSYVSALLLSC